MEKMLRKSSYLVGVQAIYRNGELIYSGQQTKVDMKSNQVQGGTDKKDEDNNQNKS